MLLSARLLAAAALATRVPLAPRPVAVRARPLVCSGLQRPNSPPLPDHLEDMAEELESGEAQLFDVREPGEVYEGMLAIAQHVPLRCNAFSFPNMPRILLRFIAFYLQTFFIHSHICIFALLSCCSELQQGIEPQGKDKTKLTYVHCAAGIRVHPASEFLQRMGFERVVPLQEGYASLLQYGFEPTFPGLK